MGGYKQSSCPLIGYARLFIISFQWNTTLYLKHSVHLAIKAITLSDFLTDYYQHYIFSQLTNGPNKLECLFLARLFQPRLIFVDKVRGQIHNNAFYS